jgi:hypothetical protein
MALPKIQHPTFKLELPSTRKKVTLRPFSVKEEKILLMARESNDEDTIIDTIKQIVSNCLYDDLNVDELPLFDIEYLIIKLRGKSVGEIVELSYKIKSGEKIQFTVNLDEIEVYRKEGHSNKFLVTDSVGVIMKYPSLSMAKTKNGNMTEEMFRKFAMCVESVYDNDNVYDEFTSDEMNDFIMSLPSSALEKISQFFNDIPKVQHKVKLKDKNGEEFEITLEGLNDFFTL